MTEFCAFPGCDNPKSPKAGGGLCNSHYWQQHKGRPLTPLSYRRNRCEPWLLAHVGHVGDDCLIWPFQRLQDSGRAGVKFRGKQTVASRVMCELAHGKPPTPQHEAAHSCGKGHEGCVNPRHLRWATHTENVADQIDHGTRVWGEKHYLARLSVPAVKEIRRLAGTMPMARIADRFGVAPNTAYKAARGITWRHV